jgi:hypothetical protein
MIETGSIVFLPPGEGDAPNGPRALRVFGRVLEIRGNDAFVRWSSGPDLPRCGIGGAWYTTEELREPK